MCQKGKSKYKILRVGGGGDVQLGHHSVQNNLQNKKVYQLIISCMLLTSVGTELHHLLLHVLLHVGVADHGVAGNICK